MTGRVEILPSQYDETIAELPEARLMYIDDDDGEVITVYSPVYNTLSYFCANFSRRWAPRTSLEIDLKSKLLLLHIHTKARI